MRIAVGMGVIGLGVGLAAVLAAPLGSNGELLPGRSPAEAAAHRRLSPPRPTAQPLPAAASGVPAAVAPVPASGVPVRVGMLPGVTSGEVDSAQAPAVSPQVQAVAAQVAAGPAPSVSASAMLVFSRPIQAQAPLAEDVAVFADALPAAWSSWSWGGTYDFASPAPVHGGSAAIAATFTSAWAGLYLHVEPILDASTLESLRFFVHGGTSGTRHLQLVIYETPSSSLDLVPVDAPAGVWTEFLIPLTSLGSPATISGIVWQDATGAAQPLFSLDDVVLIARTGPPPPPPTPGVGPALAIDAAADVHPISRDIYGMNFADEALAAELGLPVRRWGGNAASRYNWQVDATNAGSDWYFENVPEADGAADAFVAQDRRTGTRTILTVPLLGWVAKRRLTSHPYDCGFKVSVYGAQQSVDPWDADCGDGVLASGTPIAGNDPTDTSVAADAPYVTSFVAHLLSQFGGAGSGGVAFYDLDNEPMLWNSTHRDVHPAPTSYDEMGTRSVAMAAAIKDADATAATLGPVVWGWSAYFYSALDAAAGGAWWETRPDRRAHGDVPFVEWYLDQMRQASEQQQRRLLDYVDVHFYPQGDGVFSEAVGSAATQALRLRSTRALWDPAYVDESWIGEPVRLIGRMKEWVAARYPGTKLAVTEYAFGAPGYLNGALAEALALGIFGREGLDLATLWGPPTGDQPLAHAFRIFLNVDGSHHGFGETAVRATSAERAQLEVFAALRALDGALTIVVVNPTAQPLTSPVTLAGFTPAGPAAMWRYSAANLAAIVHEADLAVGATFSATFPASSITFLALPPGGSLVPFGCAVDSRPGSGGDGNGVLEPGESATVEPAWRNPGAGAVAATGAVSAFAGPAGATYTIADGAASYGSVPAGGVADCHGATGDCYQLEVSNPATRPARHWDATFNEALSTGALRTWTLHIGESFTDVPRTHWAYRFVETIYHNNITSGCGVSLYCPNTSLSRAEMAVLLEMAKHGPAWTPPLSTGTVFTDVPIDHWAGDFIETLAAEGITSGCGSGLYCPDNPITRAEMAVFLLVAEHGSSWTPPLSTGGVFTDVPIDHWAGDFIETLAAEGITGGCGGGNYCPDSPVTRAEMAVFLTATFHLTLQ